ncbi:uncharacterized protein P884DRAFT_190537 [Thermothelomyces heterothallicus CBS 202.75]|uniref:uncharacterized protein n=1 Tax=Thermothelomyces heterothallicus CBS 202.75 TaxID=1149848 RepID=UPI003744A129
MRLSSTLLAALLGLACAHNSHGQHVPKLMGARRLLSELGTWKGAYSGGLTTARKSTSSRRGFLKGRQDDDDEGRCGPGYGSCAERECCSLEGWCGTGPDYCSAPDCQINYSTACDANQKPKGVDTSNVARLKLGNVPYGGAGIYDCENAGDIALTFDDGPYLYTNDLLDILKSYDAKATFFITGTNLGKGQINDPTTIYPQIIRRMHAEGHQIASHTWSHQNASQLTTTQFTNQMIWNEIALNSILGFFPTYMRPPYSICEKNCQDILSTLGYHVVYFDLDTEGYLHDDATEIQTSKDIWDDAIDGSDPSSDNFLQIEHDIHYQTVYNLTDYILTSLFANGYRAVTVGKCLGDPVENWYRQGPNGSITVPTTSVAPPESTSIGPTSPTRTTISVAPTHTGPSIDGTCGNGVTCAGTEFGSCCSVFGWCGDSYDHCSSEKGCQPEWGSCDGSDGM